MELLLTVALVHGIHSKHWREGSWFDKYRTIPKKIGFRDLFNAVLMLLYSRNFGIKTPFSGRKFNHKWLNIPLHSFLNQIENKNYF